MAVFEVDDSNVKYRAPVDPVTAARLADDRLMDTQLKRPGRSLLVAAQYRLWCSRMTAGGLDPSERRAVLILKNLANHFNERHIDVWFLVRPWDYELDARRVRTV